MKNHINKLAFLFLTALLSHCKEEPVVYHTVTFYCENVGISLLEVKVKHGERVQQPQEFIDQMSAIRRAQGFPAKFDYWDALKTWTRGANGNYIPHPKYKFDTPVVKDFTLYARFTV